MLRIYRFAGGFFGLIAAWVAALRSDLQPQQHLAVLLVSSHCHGVLYWLKCDVRAASSMAGFRSPLANMSDVIAGPSATCCSVWSLFSDIPDLWCDHLSHCPGRGGGFVEGECAELLFVLKTCPEALTLTDNILQDIADARKDLQAHNIS